MRLLIPGKDRRGDAELVEMLRAEIARAGGAIPFATFMAHALQHPRRGYYRRGRTRAGHGGDFLTSPEAHPAFAGVVARQLAELGEALGVAEPLWVEAGAGTGTLANEVAAGLPAGARVIAVDTGDHVHPPRQEGAEPAAATPTRVRSDGLPFATGSIEGGLYANELLDAFPVHLLVRRGDRWRERMVTLEGEGFGWTEAEPGPAVQAHAEAAMGRGARPADGMRVEANLAAGAWIDEAFRVLRRGFVLLVDYGDDTPGLWGPRRAAGTLRCFASHSVHEDPLVFVGTQDITAHVDFGAVVAAARAAGFDAVAFRTQREWLADWGVLEAAAGLAARAEAGHLRIDEAEINARAVDFLADPRGLGAVKVLVLAKGMAPAALPGLVSPVPPERRFTPDDLPRTRLPDPFEGLYTDEEE